METVYTQSSKVKKNEVSSSNSIMKNISKRKKNEQVVCDNYEEEIWKKNY